MVYLVQILYSYVFEHRPATGMLKGDNASPSIILADQALLVKMLITLEPRGAYGSNFEYLCILHSPATGIQTVTRLHRASFWLV